MSVIRHVVRTLAVPAALASLAVATSATPVAADPFVDFPQPVTKGVVLQPEYELPVSGYHLTGRFGDVSGLWSHTHTGLDFAAPTGTPIRSVSAGTVLDTAYDGAYGNRTRIRLVDGTILWYCHQDSFVVHPGQRVRAGQLIGYIGSTGNVTGPHLHLEVHPHVAPVDPEPWLRAHGLRP